MTGPDYLQLLLDSSFYWTPVIVIAFAVTCFFKWLFPLVPSGRSKGLALAGFVVCLVVFFLSYHHWWRVPKAFQSEEIGILVAELPGDKARAKQNSYADAVRRLVMDSDDLRDVVKVRMLERPLSWSMDSNAQHEAAQEWGRRLGARFVIRPVSVAGGYSTWLTVVNEPEFPREEAPLARLPENELSNLDKLPLPEEIALLARCALALSYYERRQFDKSIQQFTMVLNYPNLPEIAPSRARINLFLGNSFQALGASVDAIHAYDEALRGLTREGMPDEWASVMRNRGIAYASAANTDGNNLREAIRSFDDALVVFTREKYPAFWALTMWNRGNAYQNLGGQEHSANIGEAIRCYNLAGDVFTRKDTPLMWALLLNDKGAALSLLQDSDSIRQAMQSFDDALTVLTEDRYPYWWATAMYNRANALLLSLGPNYDEKLREAIRSYDLALGVFTREQYPTEWSDALHNQGLAFQRSTGRDQVRNLREALKCYDSALEVRVRERYPTKWADTMNNRGTVLEQLAGPNPIANLREAIRSYDAALQVRTRDKYPADWAMTMVNRGNAFLKLPGPNRAANLREARHCYKEALRVYTRDRFPEEWARTVRCLAQALLLEKRTTERN